MAKKQSERSSASNGAQPKDGKWANKIVGYGEEDPEQLLASPYQWKVHPGTQQDAMLAAIRQVGLIQDVVVSQNSGHVVDGHMRVALALRTGQKSIPVKYVDLTDDEERLAIALFDPLAALAATDKALLADVLADIDTGEAALQQMLTDLAKENGLVFGDANNAPPPSVAEGKMVTCPECGHQFTPE